ncbi:MAG: protein kinase [Myxococcales bacterium]|nr:protein kinase [Myxococcales bacterium]
MLGTTIDGRYQVLALLGEGGMGCVYEARHVVTGRRLALKTITGRVADNPELIRRFEIEAKAAGAIESQHIAHVLDVGVDPASRTPYLVMEFLAGETLEQALHRHGRLPVDVALRIAGQAALGLESAHQAGIIHRDVKPANIFLAERDAGEVVTKLLDFGIAKVRADAIDGAANVTRTGSLVGTPLYMSPEQASGDRELTPSTDIWALGVVLYEMLSGATPHHHVKAAGRLIIEICSKPARPLREVAPLVDSNVEQVVMRALMLDPSARHESASAFADRLRALVPSFTLHQDMLGRQRSVVPDVRLSDPGAETLPNQPTTPMIQSVSGEADTVASNAATTGGRGVHAQSAPPATTRTSTGRRLVAMAFTAALAATAIGIAVSRGAPDAEPAAQAPLERPPPAVTLEAVPPEPAVAVANEADAAPVEPATSAPSVPGAQGAAPSKKLPRSPAGAAEPRPGPTQLSPSAPPVVKKPYDPSSEM